MYYRNVGTVKVQNVSHELSRQLPRCSCPFPSPLKDSNIHLFSCMNWNPNHGDRQENRDFEPWEPGCKEQHTPRWLASWFFLPRFEHFFKSFHPYVVSHVTISHKKEHSTKYKVKHPLEWSRGSVLAFGSQVRGFTPGRSRRIFRAKKSSARLPSEGSKAIGHM